VCGGQEEFITEMAGAGGLAVDAPPGLKSAVEAPLLIEMTDRDVIRGRA
jgi:hypothetical protein